MNQPQLHTASLTDVGCVRAHNEDHCGEFFRSDGRQLLVVSDGMGGHAGGATASHLVVETVGEVFAASAGDSRSLLFDALVAANDAVYGMACEKPELRGMGATGVALLFGSEGRACVAHVGDSRAYLLRGGAFQALTADHSVVGEMVRRGTITPEEAEKHPRRNEILRSVGVEARVEPELSEFEVFPGDRFLLCSDGLTGDVRDEEIAEILAREQPDQAAKQLVDLANLRGGRDNVTVQIAALTPAQESFAPAPHRPRSSQSTDVLEVPSAEAIEEASTVDAPVRSIALATTIVALLLVAAFGWLVVKG